LAVGALAGKNYIFLHLFVAVYEYSSYHLKPQIKYAIIPSLV